MADHVKWIRVQGAGGAGRSGIRFALLRLASATWVTFALAVAAALPTRSAEISVTLVDRDGRGVENAVVSAISSGPLATPKTGPATALKTAVMDQRNRAFVPRVLVVGVGSRVEFPNNDSVSHQVYSFSPAKHFQLPLYKGEVHPPVIFDRPGLVVLGCNIHDSMVGYILVTEAPYFGSTDASGALALKGLPKGDYQIAVWSPYIEDEAASLNRTVHLEAADSASERIALRLPLRSRPEPKPRRRDWDY
jgi:plastocyanin